MVTYIVRRLITAALILLGASFMVYLLTAASGDPLEEFRTISAANKQQLMDELITTTERSKQDGILQQIDKKIWNSAYGLPLFQTVGVVAYSNRITGVKFMPNQTGVWWNFWEWDQVEAPARAS